VKTFALALLLLPTPTAEYRFAPVYLRAADAVMERVGSFRYSPTPGYDFLYCIAPERTSVVIHCVVHTPSDRLVLIDVAATGFGL